MGEWSPGTSGSAAEQSASRGRSDTELDLRHRVRSVDDDAISMLDPWGRVATWNIGAQRIQPAGIRPYHRAGAVLPGVLGLAGPGAGAT